MANPVNPKAIQRRVRSDRMDLHVRRLTNSTALRKKAFLWRLLNQSKELGGDDQVKRDALLDIIEQYVTTIETVSLLNLRCLHTTTAIYIHNFRSQQRMRIFHAWPSCLVFRCGTINRFHGHSINQMVVFLRSQSS
jgi:hypothetical protein